MMVRPQRYVCVCVFPFSPKRYVCVFPFYISTKEVSFAPFAGLRELSFTPLDRKVKLSNQFTDSMNSPSVPELLKADPHCSSAHTYQPGTVKFTLPIFSTFLFTSFLSSNQSHFVILSTKHGIVPQYILPCTSQMTAPEVSTQVPQKSKLGEVMKCPQSHKEDEAILNLDDQISCCLKDHTQFPLLFQGLHPKSSICMTQFIFPHQDQLTPLSLPQSPGLKASLIILCSLLVTTTKLSILDLSVLHRL